MAVVWVNSNIENFNAASVGIKIVGNNVHPGSAKGVMVNALALAARYHQEVPAQEVPEQTDGYQGFYHLHSMKGTVERAEMHYIVRNFEKHGFELRKKMLFDIAEKVGLGLPPDCYIEVTITDTYYNMREQVEQHPHVISWHSKRCGIAILNLVSSLFVVARMALTFPSRGCLALICLPAAITFMVNMNLSRWKAWKRPCR